MTSVHGSTRFLLLGSLVLSGVLLAGSFWLLFSDAGDRDDLYEVIPDVEDDPRPIPVPADRDRERGTDDIRGEEDPDGGILGAGDPREPHGMVIVIDAKRLEESIERWLAEPAGNSDEMRTIIDKLQQAGKPIPAELIARIMNQLFVSEEWEKDVVLTLGMLNDDSTGVALAELATNPAHDERIRGAALEALALSGQKAGLERIMALAESDETSDRLLRRAAAALGAMGGPEASRALVGLMVKHQGRDASDAIITALAKTKDADLYLAEIARDARVDGNEDLLRSVISVALRQAGDAGAEMQREIAEMVDDQGALSAVADDEQRRRLRGQAVTAAVRIGLVDKVIRIVEEDIDGLGSLAAHSLRQARGDEAAEKIASAVDRARDKRQRRELIAALGETRSHKATPKLLKLLEDDDVDTRLYAATGLRQGADPKAAKPILEHLKTKKEEHSRVMQTLVEALGRSGVRDALPDLRRWRDTDDPRWEHLQPYVGNAIYRIETGNAEATRMR